MSNNIFLDQDMRTNTYLLLTLLHIYSIKILVETGRETDSNITI